MSLVTDFINKYKKQKQGKKYAQMLNGYAPIFSQFGKNIYASDVVQQAISCIVMEMKKLTPQHIRNNENDPIPVNDSLQVLLDEPNERMTTSDFIEKIFWSLFLHYNAFIIPTYDVKYDSDGKSYKSYTGLYPVQPVNVELLQDQSGALFITFKFLNDYETTLRYSDVIHLKYRFSVNEFMGGNEYGEPDHDALLKTLELNDILLQGVGKALKSSFAINGIIKYNTLLDDGKMDIAMKELENHLRNNESGFLPLDIKGEFIQLQNEIKLVDPDTLKFIDEKILRQFGVPLPILTGDYTKEQYEAFYQKTLEPLIINISQEFTKKLFTQREKAFGNKIKFYPHELIFMNTTQKIELFDILVDSAACYKNEMRVAFGMRPLPELVGQIAESSNKTNAENNKNGSNKDDDSADDDDSEDDTTNDKDNDRFASLRYNHNHDHKGRFTSGGHGGGAKVSSKITGKENVDKNVDDVRGGCSNEYSEFKKEDSPNISEIKSRGNCDDAEAKKALAVSEKFYSKAAEAEPQITSDVVGAVADQNGQMYGLDFRMKQPTSMAGKIAGDVNSGEFNSFEDAGANIKDSVRYTAIFETEDFTSGYNNVKSTLESKGYTETRCKNFFTKYDEGKSDQKAIQCVYENNSGFSFELQFHTYETQGAKNVNHPLYEESRRATTSTARKTELSAAMRQISSYSSIPDGVYDIEAHN